MRDKIVREREALRDNTKPPGKKNIEILHAISNTCLALGLDEERTIWSIETYADRNKALHSTVTELLQLGHFADLAIILYADRKDLPAMIPTDRPSDLQFMSKLIEALIEEYFDIPEGFEDDPRTWLPNAKAREYVLEIKNNAAKRGAKRLQIAEDTAKKTEKERAKDAANEALLESAEAGGRKEKRKASSELTPEVREACWHEQKRMTKVLKISQRVKKQEEALDNLYGPRDQAFADYQEGDNEEEDAENRRNRGLVRSDHTTHEA